MNKLMSFLNKILEFINSFFKLIIIICIIIYLTIYYQSALNQRYQYHETLDNTYGRRNIVIFDTKKGEAYSILSHYDDENNWRRLSPFSEEQGIERR
jgi:hypothetical protein